MNRILVHLNLFLCSFTNTMYLTCPVRMDLAYHNFSSLFVSWFVWKFPLHGVSCSSTVEMQCHTIVFFTEESSILKGILL